MCQIGGDSVWLMGTNVFDFSGRVVLVTGGTRGVGRGIAACFAASGARLVVAAREPAALPEGWRLEAADLRDSEQAFAMVDRVTAALGGLDVVINNAGGSPPADTTTASPRFTSKIVELNLLSAIYVSQRANLFMQQNGGGAIVNVGSVTAHRPSPTVAAYGAAKAGLANFTQTAGQEWAPRVRVNCVTPGLVKTDDATAHYGDAESLSRIEAAIPMGRMASATDVANACMFFASPLAGYITGANIVVDGGGDTPAFLRP